MKMNIPPLDENAMQAAQDQQKTLVKPIGALGQLESLSIALAGMTGRTDWFPRQRAHILFAGDHGIMQHGVSTVPQAITAYMVRQFMAGQAAINVLTRQMNARLVVVDAGVNAALTLEDTPSARFVAVQIASGTADFSQQQAMTAEQAKQALALGSRIVAHEIAQGLDILSLGEMGIGNTTSASAIIAAVTGASVEAATGRGTGIDDEVYQRKVGLIKQALDRHAPAEDHTLAKVGGFEIGALAGAMLQAASQRIPIILDGVICTAAGLIAHQINHAVRDYFIAGHCSAEPGHRIALDFLRLAPILEFDMRLGEGTGAVLALPIIESAMRTLNEMGTLDVG